MAFLNIQFPTGISLGAVGGPGYSTDVVEYGSGYENRNQNWAAARCAYDVAKACSTEQQKKDLIAFFRVAKGKANSFRFKDHSDYKVDTGEGLFTLSAVNVYQMYKYYSNAAGNESRNITLPVSGTIVVKKGAVTLTEGVQYSINYSTGLLTCLGSPTDIPTAWTGQFDVPCRFDTDRLQLIAEDVEFFRSQSIPVIEVKV